MAFDNSSVIPTDFLSYLIEGVDTTAPFTVSRYMFRFTCLYPLDEVCPTDIAATTDAFYNILYVDNGAQTVHLSIDHMPTDAVVRVEFAQFDTSALDGPCLVNQ